jgi:isoquinoline 1-oxidoreductase
VDLGAVKAAVPDAVIAQDGNFIGVAAATTRAATKALGALAQTAKWTLFDRAPSTQLFETLRQKARNSPGNPFADALAKASKQLTQSYHVSYIQHAPMEPRAAVAQWDGDKKLTVWTASQNPFGVRSELARTFNLDAQNVRVIVPDFGGGFGGKHTGECAIEAARLAKAAGKPVSLRWTRAEEFTWAYFRPAGVIDIAASVDDSGTITSWHQVNINSGPQSVETPYKIAQAKGEFVQSDPPLRHGSYRALAATANVFAREVAMDEWRRCRARTRWSFAWLTWTTSDSAPSSRRRRRSSAGRTASRTTRRTRAWAWRAASRRVRSWQRVPRSRSIHRRERFASRTSPRHTSAERSRTPMACCVRRAAPL